MTNLIPCVSIPEPSAVILIFDSVSGTLLTNATIFNVNLLRVSPIDARPIPYFKFFRMCRAMTIRCISLVPS